MTAMKIIVNITG